MNLSLPPVVIKGEFVAQRAEMTAAQTTRRLGGIPKEEIQRIALRARYLPQADMLESDEG
ncbi:hypothetical protein N7447_000929 [Penicillium robsamsonii]|uniref:uncharacterized protein n=1 Tax=Penicillium robsamsonii TaxID=1792511 RepID=UPI00254678B7|nr:uncharacterized protein N7447_000929 [Penicillium robsamsonii]KAJ5834903.1 hypothetical protein N7447_000929 [Penicillium robsamsonii]